MQTLLISDPIFMKHLSPAEHPERPNRMKAVETALSCSTFNTLKRIKTVAGTEEQILLVHSRSHIEAVKDAIPSVEAIAMLNGDTFVSNLSWNVVLHAVGGVCMAVDKIIRGNTRAFCAIRPPGHHAEKNTAMGFCLVNNAAIAARWAQKKHGLKRVAIVDFDLHHGNGTQNIFWEDNSVMYASTHQMPLYPGTGARSEVGSFNTIVNVPLKPGSSEKEFRAGMSDVILPRVSAFKPDLLIISAGFDAHKLDHLGELNLHERDFKWVTQELVKISDEHFGGRVLSVLEGGYSSRGLSLSVEKHVSALMG